MTKEQVKKLHAAIVQYVEQAAASPIPYSLGSTRDREALLNIMLEVLAEPEKELDKTPFVVTERTLRDMAAAKRLRDNSPRISDPLT